MNELSKGQFQKLLKIALSNLKNQRTLLEDSLETEKLDLRTLEQDEAIELLERRILEIQKDFDFYYQFYDVNYTDEEVKY